MLFVCTANIDRSPTAESIYKNDPDFDVKSAGISQYAKMPVSEKLLEWADVVFCMENFQKNYIRDKYPEIVINKEMYTLNIPDNYIYRDPELISRIEEIMEPWLLTYRQTKS
ncbi:MAG: hypothetical protein LBV74_17580 [Tannerella sp.]|nr:hypothetical protein [Tannerella sp.]